MSTFGWLLKREFWENRGGFFWAPLVTVVIFLLLTLMGLSLGEVTALQIGIEIDQLNLETLASGLSDAELAQLGPAINVSLFSALWLIGTVLFFVLFFYLLASLYDERKDRSILFWKSMPVSDTETVLSKVISACFVAPLIFFVAGMIMLFGFLGLVSLFLSFHGVDAIRVLWGPADPLMILVKSLYIIPINAVWALPCIGWLLLCSAFARKAPFLWATAIPVGAGVLITWFDLMGDVFVNNYTFWTQVVGRVLLSVAPGSWYEMDKLTGFESEAAAVDQMLALSSFANLSEPLLRLETWIGAIAGVIMIAAAIYLRRWRDEG